MTTRTVSIQRDELQRYLNWLRTEGHEIIRTVADGETWAKVTFRITESDRATIRCGECENVADVSTDELCDAAVNEWLPTYYHEGDEHETGEPLCPTCAKQCRFDGDGEAVFPRSLAGLVAARSLDEYGVTK